MGCLDSKLIPYASPVAPESDGEKDPATERKDPAKVAEAAPSRPVEVRIDGDGLKDRILPLPVPAGNYVGLHEGKEGVLYLVEAPVVRLDEGPEGPALTVHRFSFESRKAQKVLEGITAFVMSAGGEKALVRKGSDLVSSRTRARRQKSQLT